MHFSDMSIMEDGLKLVSESKGKHAYLYDFEFMIGTTTHRVTKVLAYHVTRDFVGNKFDMVTLDIMIGLGTWIHDIVPNKDNLRARLHRTPTTHAMANAEPVGPPSFTEWKVIIEDKGNALVSDSNEVTNDRNEANQTRVIPKTVTLVSDTVNAVRTAQVSGWFTSTDMPSLLKALFLQVGVVKIPSAAQYKSGEYEGVVGVQLCDMDNVKAYNHTYLEEGTPLRRLPNVLQRINGLYNNGVGNYLHNGLWYIYPITNVKRFENAKRRAVVYNVPKDKLYGLDKTFTIKDGELSIVATGDMKVIDNSELEQFNKGSAVRIASAANIMDNYVEVSDDGSLVADRKGNVLEGNAENRKDEQSYMKEGLRITSNSCETLSLLNKSLVSEYLFQWENSDPSLISPAMPVRLYYTKNNEAFYIDGIIAGVDSSEVEPAGTVGRAGFSLSSVVRIIGERVRKV